jgi:rubrerythrin
MATHLDVSTLTLQDALDLAVLIEKEAEERYLALAKHVGKRYPGDAADFFTMMARNENKHGVELAERRRSLFGDAQMNAKVASLVSEVEAPEFEKIVRYMTPRHALEVALESEVKAYKFYDQLLVADQSRNCILPQEVRDLIQELRDEEAEHQRLLNEMRGWYQGTSKTDYEPEVDALASNHEIT